LSNYYNYGGNSPYIYVDPDGNSIHIIVGAVIGAITGGIMGAIKGIKERKGVWNVIGQSIYGGMKGAAIGAAMAFNPALGAGVAATFSATETLAQTGGNVEKAFIAGNISFGTSMISYGAGKMGGGMFTNYLVGLGMSYGAAALTGGVNRENWDDILLSYSANFAVSAAGNAVRTGGMAILGAIAEGGRGSQSVTGSDYPTVAHGDSDNGYIAGDGNGVGPSLKKGDSVLIIVQSDNETDRALAHEMVDTLRSQGIEADNTFTSIYSSDPNGQIPPSVDELAEGLKNDFGDRQYDHVMVYLHGSSENGTHVWLGEHNNGLGKMIPSSGVEFEKYADAIGGLAKKSVLFFGCGTAGEFQDNMHARLQGRIGIGGFSGVLKWNKRSGVWIHEISTEQRERKGIGYWNVFDYYKLSDELF